MAQLEYGDYYKFIASAGIALLVAAVLLPWIFMREPFDLTVEASKIVLLTPDAQNIIHERQRLVALIIRFVPEVSLGLGLVGLLTTVVGLCMWHARQSIRDKAEALAVQKLTQELQQMSPSEITTKAREDIESVEEEQPVARFAAESGSPVQQYLAVESALLQRIRECLGHSANVMSNQRLQNVEFDAIVVTGHSEATVLEIKYIRKGFNRGWLTESANNLAAKTALYSKTFSYRARGVLLIVFAPSAQGLKRKVAELIAESHASQPSRLTDTRIRTLDETAITSIPCSELKSLLS